MQQLVQYKEVLTVYIDEQDVPNNVTKEYFKKPINENSWTNNEENEEDQQVTYTPDQLFARANLFIKLVPPDIFEAIDKAWMGLVFAIKIKCLETLELNIRSHFSIKRMCQFLLHSTIDDLNKKNTFIKLFKRAENLHSQHYGTILIEDHELKNVFKEVEQLKNHIQQAKKEELEKSYNKEFLESYEFEKAMTHHNRINSVNLAGHLYEYSKTAHFE